MTMSHDFERHQLAVIATKWGVVAVGREYPRYVKRRDGYRCIKAAPWYVIVADGEQRRANAGQARVLNSVCETPYASIGPIYAAGK